MFRKSNRLEHFTCIHRGKLYKFFRNGEEFYKTIEAYVKYPEQTKLEKFVCPIIGLLCYFLILYLNYGDYGLNYWFQ